MFGIRRETVERLRREYPVGCRVELVQMDDVQAPPIGTKGTVRGVDDIGSIMVRWDNGCGLSVSKHRVGPATQTRYKQFAIPAEIPDS